MGRRRADARWVLFILGMAVVPSSYGFGVIMDLAPPGKTTSKRIPSNRRFPSRRENKSSGESKRSAFAGAIHPSVAPSSTSSPPSSFEQRMRELVLGTGRKTNKKLTRRRKQPSNVAVVKSLDEYRRVVGDERRKIVAVRFYASYCKACQAIEPHFYRLAKDYPDTVFVDVPVAPENAALHQGLGIESLPFGHIYHPQAGLVEELRITRKQFPQFQDALQCYVRGSCELSDDKL